MGFSKTINFHLESNYIFFIIHLESNYVIASTNYNAGKEVEFNTQFSSTSTEKDPDLGRGLRLLDLPLVFEVVSDIFPL